MTEETAPVVQGLDDPKRLKSWFKAKGLHYTVLDNDRLCDALSIEDLQTFQQLIFRYTSHCQEQGLDPTDDDWKIRAETPPGGIAR